MRIATFGDVLLDVVVLLEEPLAAGGDVRASNRAGAGGQAANVAAWAAELGADARCIAKRGDDPTGELVARELRAHGVELVGPVAEGETGVVVSIVHAGDRSLASDRGVAPSFAPEELDGAWLACDVLHVSGYALLREPIAAAALLAARLARQQGARVSVDVAAWTEIRSYGPVAFRELLDELAPDVLFATEAEWELLGGAVLDGAVGCAQARRAWLHRLHRAGTAEGGAVSRPGVHGLAADASSRSEARLRRRRGRGRRSHRSWRCARSRLPRRAGSAAAAPAKTPAA